MTISRSDDCASGIHDMCSRCQCSCHGLELTIEDCRAIYNFLEHEYIAGDEFPGARDVVRKIMNFLGEHDMD